MYFRGGGKKREPESKKLSFNTEPKTKHIHSSQYQKFLTDYIAKSNPAKKSTCEQPLLDK